MITINEIIMNDILLQRNEIISFISKNFTQFDTIDELREYVNSCVFSEQDILEKHLSSLSLKVEDIDSNDFRDAQHETVETCCEYYIEIKNK